MLIHETQTNLVRRMRPITSSTTTAYLVVLVVQNSNNPFSLSYYYIHEDAFRIAIPTRIRRDLGSGVSFG